MYVFFICYTVTQDNIPGKSRWTRVLGRKTLKMCVFLKYIAGACIYFICVYRCTRTYMSLYRSSTRVHSVQTFSYRSYRCTNRCVPHSLTRVVRSTRVLLSTRYTKEHQGTSILLLLFSASYKPPLLLVLVLVLLPYASTSTS